MAAELSVKVRKIGGSLYAPIPAHVAKEEGIEEGKVVRIIVRSRERRGKRLLGRFPELPEFQRTERVWND